MGARLWPERGRQTDCIAERERERERERAEWRERECIAQRERELKRELEKEGGWLRERKRAGLSGWAGPRLASRLHCGSARLRAWGFGFRV